MAERNEAVRSVLRRFRCLLTVRPYLVWMMAGIVITDLVSKVAAYLLLPASEPGDPAAVFQLLLRVNHIGVGSMERELYPVVILSPLLISIPVLWMGFVTLLLTLCYFRKLSVVWVAVGAVAALICVLVIPMSAFPTLSWRSCVLFGRGLQLSALTLFWLLVPSKVWKFALTFWVATSLGNLLSFFYPPFDVVDFIWSKPFHDISTVGICNVADISWFLGVVMCAMAAIWSGICGVRILFRKLKTLLGGSVAKTGGTG